MKMTALELNAEMLRNMSIIAEDEGLLARAAKYLRKLVREKEADPTLMSKEEFFAKIERAEEEYRQGQTKTFANVDDLDQYIRGL